MLTIGIDQSYNSSGYAVIDEGGNVIAFGTFSSKHMIDSPIFRRAQYMSECISDLIKRFKAQDDVTVALEGLAFGMMGNATRDLAGLQFVIVVSLYALGVEPMVLTPREVKKLATGGGAAKKDAMVSSLPAGLADAIKEAGFKKTTGLYDIADAYWIGTCCRTIQARSAGA